MTRNYRSPDAKIVPFDGMRNVAHGGPCGRIETYWQEVRKDRLVPMRSDIDPRGLSGVLSNAFVLERIATGLARFRIAGAGLNDLMGLEVRGMPLSTLFLPEARQTLAAAIEAVFDEPSIVRISLTTESGFGRPALTGRMVLLPLRSDLGEVSRILGGVSMEGEIGRAPRRLGIVDQARKGLVGRGETEAGGGAFAEDRRAITDRPGGRGCPMSATRRRADGRKLVLVVDNT